MTSNGRAGPPLVGRILLGAWFGVVAVFLGAIAFEITDEQWDLGGGALVVGAVVAAGVGGAIGARWDDRTSTPPSGN